MNRTVLIIFWVSIWITATGFGRQQTKAATIDPGEFVYDLDEPRDAQTLITWSDASTIAGINDLTENTDYFITDNDGVTALLTIRQQYIATQVNQPGDSLELVISFDMGENVSFWIIATETHGKVIPSLVVYDLETPSDVETGILWNIATSIQAIEYQGYTLAQNADYFLADTVLTFANSFLEQYLTASGQMIDLLVDFDLGTATLTVESIQTQSATINPAQQNYNLDIPANLDFEITWNDVTSVAAVNENGSELATGTDYSVAGNILTINSSYLGQHLTATGQQIMLTISFNVGKDVSVTIDAVESNALVSPMVFHYDLNTPIDVVADIVWNDAASVLSVHDGTANLTYGTDYSIDGDLITITESYLAGKIGVLGQSVDLTIDFDKGENVVLTISSVNNNRVWQVIEKPGFTPGEGAYSNMVFDDEGFPLVGFRDMSQGGKASVMRYTGTNWVYLGTPGFSQGEAYAVSFTIENNTPYIAFQDYFSGSDKKATVMYYDGVDWQLLGSSRFSPGNVDHLSLDVHNGTAYLAFRDYNKQSKGTVMYFSGSTWEFLGVQGFSENIVEHVSLKVVNENEIYVGYKDWHNNIRKASVIKYDGTGWDYVGDARFSPGRVQYTSLAMSPQNKPVMAFQDESTGGKLHVMEFDGSTWNDLGDPGFSSGIASHIHLAYNAGIPYVIFSDQGNESMASVMKFAGNQWVHEGNAGISASATSYNSVSFYDGVPYALFSDAGNGGKLTMMRFVADLQISNTAYDGFTVSWTRELGDNAVLFLKKGRTGTAFPENNITYTGNAAFGSGDQIGETGWFAVYNGNATSVDVTGLEEGTWYRAMIAEYSGTAGNEQYLTGSASNNAINGLTGVSYPTTPSSQMVFSGIESYQFDLTWQRGDGSSVAVFLKEGTTGKAEPLNDTHYAASPVFGEGEQIGTSGWFCVYNGDGNTVQVTGLNHDTQYIAMAVEYRGSDIIRYLSLTAENNPANARTLLEPPSDLTYNPEADVAVFRETTLESVPQISGGPEVTFTVNPALPEGMTLDPVTGVIAGMPMVTTPPVLYTITATNEGGSTQGTYMLEVNYADYPLDPVSDVSVSDIGTGQFTLSWNYDQSDRVAVFVAQTEGGNPVLSDLTTYIASPVFGEGTMVDGTTWYTVYNGSENQVTVTDLDPDTFYRFMILPYNGVDEGEMFLQDITEFNTQNILTRAVTPDVQASDVVVTDIGIYQFTVNWLPGNGEKRVVFIRQGEGTATLPTEMTTYDADNVFTNGEQLGETGWYTVYNGTGNTLTVEGFDPETTYSIAVMEYNGIPGNESYQTMVSETNPVMATTLPLPPSAMTYNPADYTATMGVTSVNLNPSHEPGGGGVETYSISPALPEGLEINSQTGLISGTAIELVPQKEFTIQAENVSGMVETTLMITIIDVPPSGLTYAPSFVHAVAAGEPFETVPATSGGGEVISYAIDPALPDGISMDTQTGVIAGVTDQLLDETTYTITAENTGGTTTGEFVLLVTGETDLSVQNYMSDGLSGDGEQLAFTLIVENDGPSAANNVVAEFELPSGYTYQSSTTQQGTFTFNEETLTGTWNVGTLYATGSVQASVATTVNTTGSYSTRFSVVGDELDPDETNNAMDFGLRISNLRIDLDTDNTIAHPGDQVNFILTASNKGDSTATNAFVDFVLAQGFEFVSAEGTGTYDAANGWSVGEIAPDEFKNMTVKATVLEGSGFVNYATISADQHDPSLQDNVDSAWVENANVLLSMTLDNEYATTGKEVNFQIQVENNGPDPATQVYVNNAVPSGYTYTAHNAGKGVYDPSTGVWFVGEMADGESITLDVTATVNASGDYLNQAAVNLAQYDNLLTDNRSEYRIKVSDVSVNHTLSNRYAYVHDEIVFTLEAFNNGPDDAENVLSTSTYPERYKYVGHTGDGSYDPATHTWELASLANGGSATLEVTFTLEPYGEDFLTENSILSDLHDPYLNDNSSDDAIIPPESADLSIDLSIDEYRPIEHETATFTVVVSNNGRFYGNDVLVNMPLPVGYDFTEAEATKGIYNSENGEWLIDTLPNGHTETLVVKGTVVYDATEPYPAFAEVDALENGSYQSDEQDVLPIFYPIADVDEVLMYYKEEMTVNLADNDWDHYDNIDYASIKIIQQPASGAEVTVNPDGTITINYEPAPQFVNEEVIIYEISNIEGLSDISEVHVNVEVREDGHVIVPDAFSPNNDNWNDQFLIAGIEKYPGNELQVFNRWGNLVYEKTNYDNTWDGKLEGTNTDVPVGTYFYTLKLGDGLPVKKGYIYIAR